MIQIRQTTLGDVVMFRYSTPTGIDPSRFLTGRVLTYQRGTRLFMVWRSSGRWHSIREDRRSLHGLAPRRHHRTFREACTTARKHIEAAAVV